LEKIEKLNNLLVAIFDETTNNHCGYQMKHQWEQEIWNKVNECVNNLNQIIEMINESNKK
jgi:hypothetical protein